MYHNSLETTLSYIDTARESDYAWAAGFIDGEGSIGMYYLTYKNRGKKYRRIAIQVTQTRLLPLEKLQELFGGTITEIFPKGGKQRTWYWGVRGVDIVTMVYKLLQPHLLVKNTDFKEAINAYNEGATSIPIPTKPGGILN